MDAQFVNYEEPNSPLPQYTQNVGMPNNLIQKTSIKKFEDQDSQLLQPSTQESYWQRMKRFFSRTKPTKKQRLPKQQPQINPYDQFENTLNVCAQQLLSNRYDTTAILQTLIQLYTYNLQYLHNPQYTQTIDNLLRDWVAQLVATGRKAFTQCQIQRALTSDFMAFLFSIDHFLSQATAIETLRKTQAFQDLVTIVRVRLIDWFKIFIQTPGVDLEQFFNIINDYWSRFHSAPMRQLMIRISDLCNNAHRRTR